MISYAGTMSYSCFKLCVVTHVYNQAHGVGHSNAGDEITVRHHCGQPVHLGAMRTLSAILS